MTSTPTADRRQGALEAVDPPQRTSLAQRLADAPLRPAKAQKDVDGLALFGDRQIDIEDLIRERSHAEG